MTYPPLVGTNFHLKVFLDVHLSCVTLSPIFEGASMQSPLGPIKLNDFFAVILTLVVGVLGVSFTGVTAGFTVSGAEIG